MIDFIQRLQKQPYRVKLRILWGTAGVIAVVLIIIWFASLKGEIASLNNQSLLTNPAEEQPKEQSQYLSVERMEISPAGSVNIFFKINNPTDDIIALPPVEQVVLEVNGQKLNPLKIYDRQNKPFVSKVLSHTENFGILVFGNFEADKGNLVFKDLYFEQHPEIIFNERLGLDFRSLTKTQELRK